MRQQSLRIPWAQFAAARDQLVEWRSFTLWVRTHAVSGRALPIAVRAALDQRCPGFLASRLPHSSQNDFWIALVEWIDKQYFNDAQIGGWTEALHHYAGMDVRYEAAWKVWDATISTRAPARTFEAWVRQAHSQDSGDVEARVSMSAERFRQTVTEHVEHQVYALWIQSREAATQPAESALRAEVQSTFPAFRYDRLNRASLSSQFRSWSMSKVRERHGDQVLLRVERAAATELRFERAEDFAAWCCRESKLTEPNPPSYNSWLAQLDQFTAW